MRGGGHLGGLEQTLAVPVVAGKTYFIMVDTVSLVTGGSKLQLVPWQPETACDNLVDDDDFLDCDDPTGCQGSLACTPGAGAVGVPCAASTECSANHGDPVCLPLNKGFPGGYCSELCAPGADDCPAGSECFDWFHFPGGQGTCLQTCDVVADCRQSYQCADFGAPKKLCVH